jgi:hypothetical protein
MAETRFRRGVETPAEYQARRKTVAGAESATAASRAAAAKEADYAAYEAETGKSGRGLGGAAAFEKWKAGRKKKRPGVTTQDAGDALAESK